jgi:hypothetical protein
MSDIEDITIDGWPVPKLGSNPSPMFPWGMPQLEPMPGSDGLWILIEDWKCVVDGVTYYIEKGFVTDGASIPAAFWTLVGHPFDPDYVCAALLHDYLWRKCKTWKDRTFANDKFRRVLKRQGTASCWDRFSLATGVWFGKLGNALAVWR